MSKDHSEPGLMVGEDVGALTRIFSFADANKQQRKFQFRRQTYADEKFYIGKNVSISMSGEVAPKAK